VGAGAHLSDWLAFLPGMLLRQEMALRIAEQALCTDHARWACDSTTVTQPAKNPSALSYGSVSRITALKWGLQVGEPTGVADGGAAARDGRRAGASTGLMGEERGDRPDRRRLDEHADEAISG
jgi:hypothetical protein